MSMSNGKASSSSPNTGHWPSCGHGIPTTLQIYRKKDPNEGRKFHDCPFWKDKHLRCGFFNWADKDQPSSEDNKVAIERTVADLIHENEMLKVDDARLGKKIEKEEMKKTTVKEELKNMEELFCLKMRASRKWGWEKLMVYIVLILVGIALGRII